MTASKDLLAKKITAYEFLQRCSFRNAVLPSSVMDTTDRFVNDMEDSDFEESPASQSSTSGSESMHCLICHSAPLSLMALPCFHLSMCDSYWDVIREDFKAELRAHGDVFDYDEFIRDADRVNDFVIPAELLPRCPVCREGVRKVWRVYVQSA